MSYGIEFGQNLNTVRMESYNKIYSFQSSLKDSYHAGLSIKYNFKESFGFQSGVSYMKLGFANSKGTEYDGIEAYLFDIHNILIPLDFTYKTSFGLILSAGIYGAHDLNYQKRGMADCFMGESEFLMQLYDAADTYGSRYSLGMNLFENSTFGTDIVIRYYKEHISNHDPRHPVSAESLSFSLIVNIKNVVKKPALK